MDVGNQSAAECVKATDYDIDRVYVMFPLELL